MRMVHHVSTVLTSAMFLLTEDSNTRHPVGTPMVELRCDGEELNNFDYPIVWYKVLDDGVEQAINRNGKLYQCTASNSASRFCDAEPSVARLHAGWAYCEQDDPFEMTCHETGR